MDIKQIRNELKLTQEQLAHKLGVSFVTVSRWELGKAKPSPLALDKIITLEKTLKASS